METQPVRFFHRGQVRTVTDVPITQTAFQYSREDAHYTDTKGGCAEGNCSAYTVVFDELQGDDNAGLRTVDACIQFLPTLDGKTLFTVEGVRGRDGTLHPVQEAMVEYHGSQCGFCTPGFVVSLYALYEDTGNRAPIPSRQIICDSLIGNLCRCTGYRPIIDTGKRMFKLPSPAGISRAQLADTLRRLQRKDTLSYAPAGTENVPRFCAPRTASAFASIKAVHPNIRILAGNADVGLWVTEQFRDLSDILYISQVVDLCALEKRDGWIGIGAAVSLEKAYVLPAADYPEVTELWKRFTSLLVRNAGTLGGSVANGSPIDDSASVLIAIDTHIVPQHGETRHELSLGDLYLTYQKNAMEEDEFVVGLRIPAHEGCDALRSHTCKLSRHFDEDISAVCAALAIELNGDIVHNARIAYGGIATTSEHATKTKNTILGQPWNGAAVRAAMTIILHDCIPLADIRATDNHRRILAASTVYRFWLETHTNAPLAPKQINVRAVELNTLTAA